MSSSYLKFIYGSVNSLKKRDPVANFMSTWKYYHGLTKEMRLLLEIPPIDGNEK